MVIAGSGRGAGKTAVGCALMRALPELCWLAIKVTPDKHDGLDGILEELDQNSDKDTGRYLAAGARRAFLVAAEDAEGLLAIRRMVPEADGLLVESNRIALEAIAGVEEPALCVVVLSEPEVEWKASVVERMGQMTQSNRLALVGGLAEEELSPELRQKPVFRLPVGEWVTSELAAFVRARLLADG